MSEAARFSDPNLLAEGLALLAQERSRSAPPHPGSGRPTLPAIGDVAAEASSVLVELAPFVLDGARLDHPGYFAHMDPPTPTIAQVGALWAAALNQNLLHDDTGPIARQVERVVVSWFAPFFGMSGGHMVPGSSLANLTALWAARELGQVRRVVASTAAHLSVRKAALILGLEFVPVATDYHQRLAEVAGDLSDAALVVTAGTTAVGAIDDLTVGAPAWRHVDAAWAGPLMLSAKLNSRLNGIETADSVSVSAHKWLYQPKESAFVLFRDVETAHEAISFGGSYLSSPNVGIQGSHGAMALPLYLTALAWGTTGFARLIEDAVGRADRFVELLRDDARFEVWGPNPTAVVVWRPRHRDPVAVRDRLDGAFVSLTTIDGETWFRSVSANPAMEPGLVFASAVGAIEAAD